MSTLEAALRGGAVVVLLLRVVVLARTARSSQVSRYSALLLIGIAAYVVESAPGFGLLDLRWRIPIHVVSCGTPAAFWITMGALFVDEFQARWYHALAWSTLAVLGAVEMFSRSMSIGVGHSALSLLFILLGIWHALAGRATDLVEGGAGFASSLRLRPRSIRCWSSRRTGFGQAACRLRRSVSQMRPVCWH